MDAPHPSNEAERIRALHALEILDTLPEVAYDDIALLASQICRTPTSSVTFIDSARQWFKAGVGISRSEDPREVSFCAHAILTPEKTTVVPDAREDERFATNPLVSGAPFIRFYAGAPLVLPTGEAIGTLCVTDFEPRAFDPEQQRALEALARRVMDVLDSRRTLRALATAFAELQHTHVARPVVHGIIRDMLTAGSIQPSTLQRLGAKMAQEAGAHDLGAALATFPKMGLGQLSLPVQDGELWRIEGTDLIERRSGSRATTCYLTLGFLSKSLGGALGSEVACQSRGDERCAFVLRPPHPNDAPSTRIPVLGQRHVKPA